MTRQFAAKPSLGILLVEDETVAAINLECMVEELGHRIVAVAITPVQARRALLDHGSEVDLVIFGARLVGLSSLDFARSLGRARTPAMVTSTLTEADLRAEGFVEPYLAKPFQDRDVARHLRAFEADLRRAA